MAYTFTTTLKQEGNASGIEVPEEIVTALGWGEIPRSRPM